MAFIIIYQAMQNNRRRGPQPPLSRTEEIVLTIFLIAVIIGLGVGGYFGWQDYKAYTARVAVLHQKWDAGQGRPAADKIDTGKTVTIKAVANPINGDWDSCTYKTCYDENIPHYPVVIPIGSLSLTHKCYTVTSDKSVETIMVGATRADAYSIEFQSGGKVVKICAIAGQQDYDKLVLWSDSPAAAR